MNRNDMNRIKAAAIKSGLSVRDGVAFGVFGGKVTVIIQRHENCAFLRELGERTESVERVLEALEISE